MKRLSKGSNNKQWILPLALFLGLAAIAPFLDDYLLYILAIVSLNIILATGVNFVTGYTGQVSLCHAGFLGIGAYGCAIFMTKLYIPYPLALLLGALVAGCAGFLVGIPALRLRGLYLAMVTLGFGEIVYLVLHHWEDLTGGAQGLSVPTGSFGPFIINDELSLYYLSSTVAFIFVFLANNLIQSKFGRAFRSISQSEVAAQSSGVDLAKYKIFSFSLSAFYAGIAGGLYSQVLKYLSPDPFGLFDSIHYLTMIVLGGMGSIIGPIIGATLVSILPEILRDLQEYQELFFSSLLLIFILFMPKGVYGMIRSFWR